jgi:hypothetical protein
MGGGVITAREPTNHLRGDASLSFVDADHIYIMEQDEQEGEEHPNGRELAPTLSIPLLGSQFTCKVTESTQRPYQDCINLIAAYCTDREYTLESGEKVKLFVSQCDCTKKVSAYILMLNSNWISWMSSCAKWYADGSTGNPTSAECITATNIILTGEYYMPLNGGPKVLVPKVVTEGIVPVWSYKC